MQRRDFRGWGTGLGDDDFAEALAALGIFTAARVERPTIKRTPLGIASALGAAVKTRDPIAWRMPDVSLDLPLTAEVFRDAWRSRPTDGVRLELRSWGDASPLWLIEQLSRQSVGAYGVYARMDEPSVDVAWEWPLWIGLLTDERSRRFRSRFEGLTRQSSWLPGLTRLVDLSSSSAECDLLLLPHDVGSALGAVGSAGFTIRADCTLVMGRSVGGDARLMAQIVGLRGLVRTSGVVFAHIPRHRGDADSDPQMWWLRELLRYMTHNDPLDVALLNATRQHAPESVPLFVGSRKLVEFSRLALQISRMANRYRAMAKADDTAVSIPAGSAFERTFGMSGAQPRSRIADALDQAAASASYVSEGREASAAAVDMAEGAADAPTRRRESRFIQAQAYDMTDGSENAVERHRALRPLAPHEIRVRIGPPDKKWITDSRVFSEEELPPDQPEYKLTIVLTDTSYQREPQVGTVDLPAVGTSSEVTFYVQAGVAGSQMQWRIAVAYENRVLQTALLDAPVADDDASDSGITIESEAIVRPTFEDLHGRTRFDAALILNHAPNGGAGLVAMADGNAKSFPVGQGMQNVVRWFDTELTNVARQRSTFEGGLGSDAPLELLRRFAQQGAALYRYIVKDWIGDGALARGSRLHVVAAEPEARVPLEFVYSKEGPRDDAKLCKDGTATLAKAAEEGTDVLPAVCTHPDDDTSVVCPLGFWGVQKVIERHRHDPILARAMDPRDQFLLRAEPARDRKPLTVLRAAIAGANFRVDEAGMKTVCDRLKKATSAEISPLTKWEDWTTAVANTKPSILVAIVHNENKDNNPLFPRMEIGRESWVDPNGFNSKYYRPGVDNPEPLLLLLACEVGSTAVTFNSFVSRARQEGAAIIVAAGAQIHAAHAVTVTCDLIDALETGIARAAAAGKEVTFGDVFRNVRRAMLARGVLMVLTLETYGDADWRLQTTQ